MNTIHLANSIKHFAISNYIPFQGFNEDIIIPVVQGRLPVSAHDVRVALEYIAQKGE